MSRPSWPAAIRSRAWSTTFWTWRWWNPARCGWSWSASTCTRWSATWRAMRANGRRRWALTLDVDVAPDAGRFLADARRLRQIVFNLLSNAFKFTPRGGDVTLSARIVGEDVQISVADNGPGIPPDVKANVFERFSAKGGAGQRAGAGLGLALVNRFLELHDGWVEIESTAAPAARWCAATCPAASTTTTAASGTSAKTGRRRISRGPLVVMTLVLAFRQTQHDPVQRRRHPHLARQRGCWVAPPARNPAWSLPSRSWAAASPAQAAST